ncbi:MAG: hypothetical protein RIT81_27075 [Deltaproteobacteria bacterium]
MEKAWARSKREYDANDAANITALTRKSLKKQITSRYRKKAKKRCAKQAARVEEALLRANGARAEARHRMARAIEVALGTSAGK